MSACIADCSYRYIYHSPAAARALRYDEHPSAEQWRTASPPVHHRASVSYSLFRAWLFRPSRGPHTICRMTSVDTKVLSGLVHSARHSWRGQPVALLCQSTGCSVTHRTISRGLSCRHSYVVYRMGHRLHIKLLCWTLLREGKDSHSRGEAGDCLSDSYQRLNGSEGSAGCASSARNRESL